MEFSRENIEAAATEIKSSNNGPSVQSALDFLQRWSSQPESLVTAVDLLTNSENEQAKFYAGAVLSNGICSHWGKIESNELKGQLIDGLVALLASVTEDSSYYMNVMLAISHIALFEWPERWDRFLNLVIGPEAPANKASMRLLATVMEDLHTTQAITGRRRQRLLNLFQDQLPLIMERVVAGLSNPEFAVEALKIYRQVVFVGSFELVIPQALVEALLTTYLLNPTTTEVAVECLEAIFISRIDASEAIRSYSTYLIHQLATLTYPNGLPVTTNSDVVRFIVSFLMLWSSVHEELFVANLPKGEDEPDMAIIWGGMVSDLMQKITEKGINLADLRGDFLKLVQVVLSQDVGEVSSGFFSFWTDLFRRMHHQKLLGMPNGGALLLFGPLINDIRAALFEHLSEAPSEDNGNSALPRSCWSMLLKYDIEGTVRFMLQQTPSEKLAYALASLEFFYESKTQPEILELSKCFRDLIGCCSSTDNPEIVAATLFAFSRAAKILSLDPQLLDSFVEMATAAFGEAEKSVSAAAAEALFSIVEFYPSLFLFKESGNAFSERIVEQAENCLKNLETNASALMFKTGMKIAQFYYDSVKDWKYFDTLMDPVHNALENFQSLPVEFLERTLKVVAEVAQCQYADSEVAGRFHNLLIPQMTALAAAIIPSPCSETFLTAFLEALVGVQLCGAPEEQENDVSAVYPLLIQRRPAEPCIFHYIQTLRKNMAKMDELYERIFNDIISPAMSDDSAPIDAILNCVSTFGPTVLNFDWVCGAAISAIRDTRRDVSKAGILCLDDVFEHLGTPEFEEVMARIAEPLFAALFQILTDAMHKEVFSLAVSFIHINLLALQRSGRSNDDLKGLIISSLQANVQEPAPGLFEQFASCVLERMPAEYLVSRAFSQLLIMLRMATPGDDKEFQVYKTAQKSLDMFFSGIRRGKPSICPVVFVLP